MKQSTATEYVFLLLVLLVLHVAHVVI